ncbi:hypothetical protein D7B24_000769 [Verticillium nonalfalfae]|uniref:Uncharacterized protein n=1 Tax=Verticillium nonalfalfae TaxID=1051616 RepID=A0A3M9Y2A6_9PEZI|nr:uncharacterized protein D7B24_000769 [Verticillium nonalfalfae]RNJ54245.1 hypothetical protein D7B24_000769 [Verticillium nonalfalfae]
MAPKVKAVRSRAKPPARPSDPTVPPAPFKAPASVLAPFLAHLDPAHVYITHIDLKPRDFKRNIFLVPLGMNVVVVLLFLLRTWSITPYYWRLVQSGLGTANETTFPAATATWAQIAWEVAKRGATFSLDLVLVVFVWPWPVEFALGRTHGNPLRWRRRVGFRDKEIYVRRSRDWDRKLRTRGADGDGDGDGADVLQSAETRGALLALVRQATSPMLQHEKTGYLTMNGEWDLDWEAMVTAHAMVDRKAIAVDAFRAVVLVHHVEYGWMALAQPREDAAQEADVDVDARRRQVFEFRDALAAVGKEDLFFRWIEIVQYESTQPGGFGPERQVDAAKKIRDLFSKEGIDFDEFWKESVGEDAEAAF